MIKKIQCDQKLHLCSSLVTIVGLKIKELFLKYFDILFDEKRSFSRIRVLLIISKNQFIKVVIIRTYNKRGPTPSLTS